MLGSEFTRKNRRHSDFAFVTRGLEECQSFRAMKTYFNSGGAFLMLWCVWYDMTRRNSVLIRPLKCCWHRNRNDVTECGCSSRRTAFERVCKFSVLSVMICTDATLQGITVTLVTNMGHQFREKLHMFSGDYYASMNYWWRVACIFF